MDINKTDIVFVDTDAFLALYKADDGNHKKAKEIATFIEERKYETITSVAAYSEFITIVSQRISFEAAIEAMAEFEKNIIPIIMISDTVFNLSKEIFQKQNSKNVSFTDCVNMAIMRQFGINYIFSFDRDYKKNKFMRLGID